MESIMAQFLIPSSVMPYFNVRYTHMESPDEEGLLCQELPELTLSLGEVPLELVQLRPHQPPLHLAGLSVTQPSRVLQRPAPIRAPYLCVQSALESVHVARIAAQNCRIHSHLLILLLPLIQLLQHALFGLIDLYLLLASFGFLLLILLFYFLESLGRRGSAGEGGK